MTEDKPVPDDGDDLSLDRPLTDPDRDGVAALHDTEAGAGDEAELEDLFDLDQHEAREIDADRDGVAALHDTEAEAGDEAELEDLFDLDQHEAREIDADLDSPQRNEPRLD